MELEEQPNDQDGRTTQILPATHIFHGQNRLYNNILQPPLTFACQIRSSGICITIGIIWWLTQVFLMRSFLLLFLTSEQKGLQHLGLYFKVIFSFHGSFMWNGVFVCYPIPLH